MPLETVVVLLRFSLCVSTFNVAVVDYMLLLWRLHKSESARSNHRDRT
jgi:hypothetical protein